MKTSYVKYVLAGIWLCSFFTFRERFVPEAKQATEKAIVLPHFTTDTIVYDKDHSFFPFFNTSESELIFNVFVGANPRWQSVNGHVARLGTGSSSCNSFTVLEYEKSDVSQCLGQPKPVKGDKIWTSLKPLLDDTEPKVIPLHHAVHNNLPLNLTEHINAHHKSAQARTVEYLVK